MSTKGNIGNTTSNKKIQKENCLEKYFYSISGIILIIIILLAYLAYFKKNQIQEEKEKNNYFNFIEEEIPIIKKPPLDIAIDFGNYKTGFSYFFNKNIKEINIGKTQPTIITLFKKNLTSKNYGRKTLNSIINYNEKEKSEIIFLNNLKFNLFNNKQNINKKFEYLNKKAVIEYLKLFSQGVLKEINSDLNDNYIKEEVNWYITVPRFWDERFKLLMIECAKGAGLKNIDLVLDTEAASLSFLNDNSVHKKYKQKGSKYMLIDLGEYKYDIVVNEIIDNDGSIRQLLPPFGNEYNSININEELLNIIYKILGLEQNENLKQKMITQNLRIIKDLENIISKFDESESDLEFQIYINDLKNNKNSKNNKINIFFYKNFQIKYDNYKINLPGKLIEEIILKKVNEIIEFIKSLKNKYEQYKIDHFILTGGFSNCKILIKKFKKVFKDIHISILINQEYSVVKGAILYAHNPKIIKIRQSHYIYGILTFKNKIKEEICKKQVVYNNVAYCEIIEKLNDKEIKNNLLFQKKISTISPMQEDIFIFLYRNKNNVLTNSEDNYYGKFKLNLNNNENWKSIKILLSIEFSSYLKITAFDYFEKIEINIIFYPKNIN